MVHDYPDYYKKFKCVGGTCPDSCCIGWEVDIDDDTWEYYDSIEGEFGERLREHMRDDGEDRYFTLCENGRCPFLNDRNLCDIILNIGEESLSLVCTEYPRYFLDAGDYEQADMSLSCMEVGRIVLTDPEPIHYVHEEDELTDEPLDETEAAHLEEILAIRDHLIAVMEDRNRPFDERLEEVMQEDATFARHSAGVRNVETLESSSASDPDADLLELMQGMDVLDDRWIHMTEAIQEDLENIQDAIDDFDAAMQPELEIWQEKLACYFIYRYVTDAYFAEQKIEDEAARAVHPGVAASLRMMVRSLRFIHLMCVDVWGRQEGRFSVEDLIDVVHLYSREIEHSEDNVNTLKYTI